MSRNRSSKWLLKDTCSRKAALKHDIKRLEACFEYYLSDVKKTGLEVQKSTELCLRLCQQYESYLKGGSSNNTIPVCSSDHDHVPATWIECHAEIKRLKIKRAQARTIMEETAVMSCLLISYQHFSRLLTSETAVLSQSNLSDAWADVIKPFGEAPTPENWLKALVRFVNQQSGVNRHDCLLHLSKLNNQDLLALSQVFQVQDCIQIMNAIFFYRLNPQKLFDHTVHAEKLISVKTRLSLLYECIEMLHQSVTQVLTQRGLTALPDYLFHGDELPEGIEIQFNEANRAFIFSAIKASNLNVSVKESHDGMNQVQEIIRAYKFWFNPNRLVDAVMRLNQKQDTSGQLEAGLFNHMRHLYQQLATTDCLDLYGYFTNKDTDYFMRTLAAAKSGNLLSWLPGLNETERQAIEQVYTALEVVMHALRSVLEARYISTEPYNHNKHSKKLTPGRRNRNAVFRVITLYAREKPHDNRTLEHLFQALETLG